jgi:hypothetical protein
MQMNKIFEKHRIPDFYFNQYFRLIHDIWFQIDQFLYNNLTLDLWNLQTALKINANGEYI